MPENRRPGSARPCRRRKRLSKTSCLDEDVFQIDTNYYNPEPKISSTRTTSRSDYGSSNSANISPMDKNPDGMEIGSMPTSNRSPNRQPLINMQQMRSFNIDGSGKIVDCGFHYGRISTKPLTPRMSGSRRATCPEIWLSRELEKKDAINVALRIYGAETVGKKSLIKQMSAHADISGKYDESSIGKF
uniref:Uncharacterized protein n=1 Tax=Panagrolaimus davidi TaxID=227884 RepID=A0A914PW90_9BILA